MVLGTEWSGADWRVRLGSHSRSRTMMRRPRLVRGIRLGKRDVGGPGVVVVIVVTFAALLLVTAFFTLFLFFSRLP